MSQVNLSPPPSQTVYIYAGPGSCAVAINHTKHTLSECIHPRYTIQTLSAEEVKQGHWIKDACLFIMPGGADILYARTLKGKGNQQIQSFVQDGGRYFGICAGAYYGSRRLLFAKGTPQEIASDRELGFFPDTAEGPTLKPWDHRTNSGADTALVQWTGSNVPFPKNHHLTVYYNGGGHFVNAQNYPEVTILANYASTENPKTAIVDVAVGKGQVILSGVHCEFVPELFDMTDPFLAPLQEKLMATDHDRRTLIVNLLHRLNIETTSRY